MDRLGMGAHSMRLLVTAFRTGETGGALLLLEDERLVAVHEHRAHLRGLCRHRGRVWVVDHTGNLYTVRHHDGLHLVRAGTHPRCWYAHDLSVFGDRLGVVSPAHGSIVLFDPDRKTWSELQPLLPIAQANHDVPPERWWNWYHLNSVVADGEGYLLSLFTLTPKPRDLRWRDFIRMTDGQGVIIPWGRSGFGDPLVTGLRCPHSLRRHQGELWFCNSYDQTLRTPQRRIGPLGAYTRGLDFEGNLAMVGLSRHRYDVVSSQVCGVGLVDFPSGQLTGFWQVRPPYLEVYDVLVVD